MSIELFIPLQPKSPNQLLNMHWSKRAKYKLEIQYETLVAKNMARIYGRPLLSPVRIDVEFRLYRSVELDYDNAVGACKPFIDALTQQGLIPDDSPEHVTGVFVTQKRGPRAERGALIRITPEG